VLVCGCGFNLGHLEPTLVKKRHNIFQVGSWRKDEWKPHGKPRKKLIHQFFGEGAGGCGESGVSLWRVSVTFVRQDSTAFIRFGEWVSCQYKKLGGHNTSLEFYPSKATSPKHNPQHSLLLLLLLLFSKF
jgi:hypothetical protein